MGDYYGIMGKTAPQDAGETNALAAGLPVTDARHPRQPWRAARPSLCASARTAVSGRSATPAACGSSVWTATAGAPTSSASERP